MDGRIRHSLGAILAIDAVGYSRQMGRDEEATLRRLQAYRDVIGGVVTRFGGRVFGVAGDSEMAVLPGALEALECALAIQDEIAERNEGLPEERRMPLRIGINFGKTLIEGEGVYGDDVNIAARVEALAGKGGVCLTGAVFDRVEGKLPLGYENYGRQRFKNIDRRVRAYRVRREPEMVGRVVPGKPPFSRSRWRKVAAAALVAVAGASAWGVYLRDEMVGWRTTAAEQAAATATARARAETLVTSLEAAETRVTAERKRAAALLAGLRTAERAAAGRSRSADAASWAGAERAQALLVSLREAEARVPAERARAEALLAALREAEARTATARDAAALRNSWEAAERQAAAERARAERLISALEEAEARAREETLAAAEHAAARAEAERATAVERARAVALVAALQAAEGKAAEESRKGETLTASLEGALERVRALRAELQAAGQTAAAERKRAELLIAASRTPDAGTAHEVRKGKGACADAADTAKPWIGNWSAQNGDAIIRMNITGQGLKGQLETSVTTHTFSGGVSDTGYIRITLNGRSHWDGGVLGGKFPVVQLRSRFDDRSFGRLDGRKFRLCS